MGDRFCRKTLATELSLVRVAPLPEHRTAFSSGLHCFTSIPTHATISLIPGVHGLEKPPAHASAGMNRKKSLTRLSEDTKATAMEDQVAFTGNCRQRQQSGWFNDILFGCFLFTDFAGRTRSSRGSCVAMPMGRSRRDACAGQEFVSAGRLDLPFWCQQGSVHRVIVPPPLPAFEGRLARECLFAVLRGPEPPTSLMQLRAGCRRLRGAAIILSPCSRELGDVDAVIAADFATLSGLFHDASGSDARR